MTLAHLRAMVPLATAAPDSELTGLVGWVERTISSLGEVGVALLVALETAFPPIPSEVVLPFAGFVAAREGDPPWAMVLAATIGSMVGAILLYEVGRLIGEERARRWLVAVPLVEGDEVDRALAWFHRHGTLAVLSGRFVPIVRSLVSLPAGAARMPRPMFLLWTFIGSGVWNLAWIWGGWILGDRWRDVGRYADWLNVALVVGVVLVLAREVWLRIARRRRRTTDT